METPLTRIENWLLSDGKTWADLARALGGYSEQRLQNWKKRGIPMGAYPRLAQATGLSIDYIATGRTEPHANTQPGQGAERPPIIEEDAWKALPTKTRALVEDIIQKSADGSLNESALALLIATTDTLSSKK